MPLLRHKQLLIQPCGKLIAHAADIIHGGPVKPLGVGHLQIQVRQKLWLGQYFFIQIADQLFHLALLALSHRVYIHGGIHKIAQQLVGFVHFLAEHRDLAFQAVLHKVGDHGGNALTLGVPQYPHGIGRQLLFAQHARRNGILDIVVQKRDMVGPAHAAALQGSGPVTFGVGHNAVAHLPGKVQPLAAALEFIHYAQALLVVRKPAGAQRIQRALARMAKRRVPQIMPQSDGLGQIFVQLQGPGNGAGDLAHL